METRRKLIALELVESLFGWVWLLALLFTLYAAVSAMAFGGSWRTVLIAFVVSGIGKWLARAFGEVKGMVAADANEAMATEAGNRRDIA